MAVAGGALRRGGRARGGARVGSKSRCPLARHCRGNQHILVLPLRQSHLAQCRSARPGGCLLLAAAAAALAGCRLCPAAGRPALLRELRHAVLQTVCRAAWDKTRPWYAEIASAGGCVRQARGGVAGSKPPSGRGWVQASWWGLCVSVPGLLDHDSRSGGKTPTRGVGWGEAPACPLSPIRLLGRGCHSCTQ